MIGWVCSVRFHFVRGAPALWGSFTSWWTSGGGERAHSCPRGGSGSIHEDPLLDGRTLDVGLRLGVGGKKACSSLILIDI